MALPDSTLVFPLGHLSVVQASGPDVDTFLQGQLSNDIRRLTPERGQLAAYCSPKGRVLALPTLTRAADGSVSLELAADLVAETLKRLKLYVLRSKVKLDDASERLGVIGIAGPQAAAVLAKAGLKLPEDAPLACAATGGIVIQRRAGALARYSLIGPKADLADLLRRWSPDHEPGDDARWRLLDIRAGQPNVFAATRELFVPQSLNLDLIGGVSFDKGCYPGQEIVARLHYLGAPKRRLLRAATTGAPPAPGTPIFRAGEAQAVAEVVDAATAADGSVTLLASAQTRALGTDVLELRTAAGAQPLTSIETLN